MTRNQASGGESVASPRSHGCRQRNLLIPAVGPAALAGPFRTSTVADTQDVICVQAVTHCWNGTQSCLPLSQVASGVFQNLIVLK